MREQQRMNLDDLMPCVDMQETISLKLREGANGSSVAERGNALINSLMFGKDSPVLSAAWEGWRDMFGNHALMAALHLLVLGTARLHPFDRVHLENVLIDVLLTRDKGRGVYLHSSKCTRWSWQSEHGKRTLDGE